jgi:DNA polymerase V
VALVDCNNFYVSCERVFAPRLRNRPVVVLSNNDGNAVALSAEAKEIGIPFGAPYFQIKNLLEKHGGEALSSNYPLYGDMSGRVMNTLSAFSPEIEIYSIDEAFLSLKGIKGDLYEAGRAMREAVFRYTGIPVSVGIASTKTLAKLANRAAKRDAARNGVLDLSAHPRPDSVLEAAGAGDVWGVGPAYAEKLRSLGVFTALQLRDMDDRRVRKNMTVTGLRTVHELRGMPCIEEEDTPASRRSVACTRSFGVPVMDISDLREAASAYASRAAEKLRARGLTASAVTFFLTTNRFKKEEPQYSPWVSCTFAAHTCYTPLFIRAALKMLEHVYRPGYRYKKCGVILSGTAAAGHGQLNLFDRPGGEERAMRVMEAVDTVNSRLGRGSLFYASGGTDRPWSMRRQFLSPRYTTRWDEIPVVR